jgi:hypothetical protein
MSSWRDRRVPEFQQYLRSVLGREPTERDYAAAIMQLEQRGAGSVAVGHAFHNRLATEGGDPTRHLRHYDPVALGHRWHEVTPQAIDKWGAEYDRIASGSGPLQAGQTHFFSPAGMRAYYEKDPSLVRSAVRMTVPGHGEVLVPNWATRAVADGNFTNINGEWFLTPNERYGKEPAPVRVASQDAEAQPGGFYGNPVPASPPQTAPPTTYAAASSAPDASTAVPKPSASESMFGGDAVSKAMRIASLISPKSSPQKEDEGIKFEPLRHDHRPLGDASGGLQMAAASVPYLKRADGGEVKYPEGGAGRFASPVSLVATQADKDRGNDTALVGRMMDRMTGVGRMTYANGGSVDDTGITMPETPESLLAQQRQLIEGRRIAQMFPAGTEELPLPPGMERVETPRGVFHFDPMRISAREVVEASNSRRENEVLGLGPMSKDDVARIMQQTGEEPVSIVERDPMGNEVRGSLATPSTVGVQADTILRTADPKHVVDVEPVEDVIAQRAMRVARAEGGKVDRKPELHAWEPPWYNRAAYGVGDALDYVRESVGLPPLTTGQRYDLNKTVSEAPVFSSAAGVAKESADARREFDHGEYVDAAKHLGMAGLHGAGLAGTAYGAQSAVRGMPSARQTMRENRAWEANTPRGRSQTEAAQTAADASAMTDALKARNAAEIKDVERALARTRDPAEQAELRDTLGKLRRGEDVDPYDLSLSESINERAGDWANSSIGAKVGSVAGGTAISDYAWNGGFMPWNWNEPGTLQHEIRNGPPQSDAAKMGAPSDADMKYPPGFPRMERTEAEMRKRFDESRTGDARDNRYGILGGGKMPYDEWLSMAEKYGMTLSYPPSMNGVLTRNADYPVRPESKGYGPGPYPAAPNDEPEERAAGGGIGAKPFTGALYGATGGRADKLPGTARSGSHVIPADIVSHMGQGNTNAGLKIMDRMFGTGPYGMSLSRRRRADGGAVEQEIPVALSDGEYVIEPEVVASLGNGDIDVGHDVLDAWIMQERQNAINTLASLPPPATD